MYYDVIALAAAAQCRVTRQGDTTFGGRHDVLFSLHVTALDQSYFFIRHINFMRYNNIQKQTLIVPRFRESVGTLNLIRLSVCPSVTKTLTWAITFALLQIELSYLACVFLVTRPFRWYHVVTFDLLQGQICCRAGDHNSLNLLVIYICSISHCISPNFSSIYC